MRLTPTRRGTIDDLDMIRRKLWRRSPSGATKSLAREERYMIQAAK